MCVHAYVCACVCVCMRMCVHACVARKMYGEYSHMCVCTSNQPINPHQHTLTLLLIQLTNHTLTLLLIQLTNHTLTLLLIQHTNHTLTLLLIQLTNHTSTLLLIQHRHVHTYVGTYLQNTTTTPSDSPPQFKVWFTSPAFLYMLVDKHTHIIHIGQDIITLPNTHTFQQTNQKPSSYHHTLLKEKAPLISPHTSQTKSLPHITTHFSNQKPPHITTHFSNQKPPSYHHTLLKPKAPHISPHTSQAKSPPHITTHFSRYL